MPWKFVQSFFRIYSSIKFFFYQICLSYTCIYAIPSWTWCCWLCCFDAFLNIYRKMSIFELFWKFSNNFNFKQFRKIDQLFVRKEKSDLKKKMMKKNICVLVRFFCHFICISGYFSKNCRIFVFDVMSTTSVFFNLFHLFCGNLKIK